MIKSGIAGRIIVSANIAIIPTQLKIASTNQGDLVIFPSVSLLITGLLTLLTRYSFWYILSCTVWLPLRLTSRTGDLVCNLVASINVKSPRFSSRSIRVQPLYSLTAGWLCYEQNIHTALPSYCILAQDGGIVGIIQLTTTSLMARGALLLQRSNQTFMGRVSVFYSILLYNIAYSFHVSEAVRYYFSQTKVE